MEETGKVSLVSGDIIDKLPCCKYVNMAILRQRNPIDKSLES